MEILACCPDCQTWQSILWNESEKVNCPSCGTPWLQNLTEGFVDQCAMCGAAHLYRQKDFNRKLGVGLVIVGVLLAYWTYGISLGVVTLIDWFLFRRVGEVGCCYRCLAQYRKSPLVDKMPTFDLELQDYYRNLKG